MVQDLSALVENCRLPRHYYIDIGNYCNLRCPFCVTGAMETKAPKGFMTEAAFATIFAKIKDHAELISLYNWGEPLMNRDLLAIIGRARSNGARVHIDTNLALRDMTDQECEDIVRSGLYSLFASIDGITQETYQKYRVRGNQDRVFQNLQSLIAAKLRLCSPWPVLGWQFHVNAFNEHEIQRAREKAYDLGIGIVFKRLNSPDPTWHSSIHQDAFMTLSGEAWFRQTYMPPENPDFNSDDLHPAVRSPCSQLFGTMTVAWNGDVMPCTCVEGPDYAMGNLFEQELDDIWNGGAFAGSRKFVAGYGPRQHGCSVCETLSCPVQQKYIGDTRIEPELDPNLAGFVMRS